MQSEVRAVNLISKLEIKETKKEKSQQLGVIHQGKCD